MNNSAKRFVKKDNAKKKSIFFRSACRRHPGISNSKAHVVDESVLALKIPVTRDMSLIVVDT